MNTSTLLGMCTEGVSSIELEPADYTELLCSMAALRRYGPCVDARVKTDHILFEGPWGPVEVRAKGSTPAMFSADYWKRFEQPSVLQCKRCGAPSQHTGRACEYCREQVHA